MRVCFRRSDGAILESQTNDEASLDVLIENAKSSGFSEKEIEVRLVPDEEFFQLFQEQNPIPDPKKTALEIRIEKLEADMEDVKVALPIELASSSTKN